MSGTNRESTLKAQRTQTEAEPGDGHKPYEHQAFPKMLYNADGKSLLVATSEEYKSIDKGAWRESAAEFTSNVDIDKLAKAAIKAGAKDK